MSISNSPERVLSAAAFWPKEESRTVAHLNPQAKSDEQLLDALKCKNQDALAELFRRYSRLAFSIGFRILRDAGEAEEIVQEVFLFLYQRAELFDGEKGAAKAWLVQVTYHRSLDRKEYLYRRNFYSGTDVAPLADTLRGRDDVGRDLELRLSRERLKDAFHNLSERQRITLELYFFEDMDLREIATRLNESFANIRHHYYRGLQKLRKDALVKELKDENRS